MFIMPGINAKTIWAKVLKETPLPIRRRASAYLKNVQKISEKEWTVTSEMGAEYQIRLGEGQVTCSCPYFTQEKGYCKHICAVAAFELIRLDVTPWLRKLDEKLL